MTKPQSTSSYVKRPRRISDERVYDTIVEMVRANPEKAIRPEDVARSLRDREWQGLLKRIRLFVAKLASDGYVAIMRKGRIADPDDFKGVYRIVAGENTTAYVARMPQE
ncbi:MAG: DUF3253 domain-containing protein [Candidatus Promineifilaceae bacterium]